MGPLNIALCNRDWTNLNLKFFGYEMARRLAAELPVRDATVARQVGLACKPSTQATWKATGSRIGAPS